MFYTKELVGKIEAMTEEEVADQLEKVTKKSREYHSMKKKDLKELAQKKFPQANLKGKTKDNLVEMLVPIAYSVDHPLINRGRELAQRYNGYLRP